MASYLWIVGIVVYVLLGLLLLYPIFRKEVETPSLWTYRIGFAYSSLTFTDKAAVAQYLAKGGISDAVIVQLTDGTRYDLWVSAVERRLLGEPEIIE